MPNGSYYARIKVGGKVIRRTLETATFSTARLRLLDFLREHQALGLKPFENPAREIPRVRVKQKHLVLPEPDQFRALVHEIRTGSGGRGPRIAELVKFLAYSGLRAFSEAAWVTWADLDWNRLRLRNGASVEGWPWERIEREHGLLDRLLP